MVESIEDLISRQKRERAAMRAQISRRKNDLIAIPEPVVIQNDCAVKGLKILDDGKLMILGLENGEVKVVDKVRFSVFTVVRFAEASILKVDQILQAVLIQYKDLQGSIFVCKPPSQANRYSLEQVMQIKTMSTSFCTFGAEIIFSD